MVQSLSCVWLFATPWTAARQASLSFTISRSLLKLMSIKLVMPSNHLIPFPAFNLSQHQGLFQWVSSSHQMAKVLDEMVGRHHQLDGHEFEQAPGVGDGREACHTTVHGVTKSQTQLSNWTEMISNLCSVVNKTTFPSLPCQMALAKYKQKALWESWIAREGRSQQSSPSASSSLSDSGWLSSIIPESGRKLLYQDSYAVGQSLP